MDDLPRDGNLHNHSLKLSRSQSQNIGLIASKGILIVVNTFSVDSSS